MKIIWMRTAANGQTVFEDLEVAARHGERGAERAMLPDEADPAAWRA